MGQFHIGALAVVGPQYAGDQEEEVEQPPLGKCSANGQPAIPFAQQLVQHVRMGHCRPISCRVGLQGDNTISGLVTSATQIEPDLKGSQVDPFQDHRCGANHKHVAGTFVADLGKLLSERYQVPVHITEAGGGREGGSCHLFRHTMATLMLEGGADIRFIQAILGHSNLETTQVYTRVSIRKLQEVHTETHPARSKHCEAPPRPS